MSQWTLVAAGDLCNARVDLAAPFDREVVGIIRRATVSVANLEAPVCDQSSAVAKSGPALRIPPAKAQVLGQPGFTLFALANNHIMDHGLVGLEETLVFLSRLGAAHVGAATSEPEAYAPVVRELPGARVAIFSLCEREFGVATDGAAGAAWIEHPRVYQSFRSARAMCEVVVVVAHGGIELSLVPPRSWRATLRGLIDEGADIVIGHHPHVVQGYEHYRSGFIFYSLGDFYWPLSGGVYDPRRALSVLLELKFQRDRLESFTLHPLFLDRSLRLSLAGDPEAAILQRTIGRLSEILRDDPLYADLWTAVAVRLYRRRYHPRVLGFSEEAWPKDFVRALAVTVLNLGHVLGGGVPRTLVNQFTFLLNVLQNPSHREVCEIGLRALAGMASPCNNTPLEILDRLEADLVLAAEHGDLRP